MLNAVLANYKPVCFSRESQFSFTDVPGVAMIWPGQGWAGQDVSKASQGCEQPMK